MASIRTLSVFHFIASPAGKRQEGIGVDKSFLLTLLPISFVLGGSPGEKSNITVLVLFCFLWQLERFENGSFFTI